MVPVLVDEASIVVVSWNQWLVSRMILDIANLGGTIPFGKVFWDCCRLQMPAQGRVIMGSFLLEH